MPRVVAMRLAIVLAGLAVLTVAMLIVGSIARAAYQAPPASQYPAGYNPNAPIISHVLGIPAVQPRTGVEGQSGPAFTAADVVRWVETHPTYNSAGTIPVVDSVQFMTSAQVSADLRGESTGMPDDALLCFVRVHGSFVSGGPAVPGQPPAVNHYQTGYLVFDAHTGNLIMSSV